MLPLFTLFLAASVQDPDALRMKIRDTFHVPRTLPAVETRTYGSFEPEPGVTAERISYVTQLGMRVPAIVYRPTATATTKRPALVIVNGHGGDKYTWYSVYSGILFARSGAVVITYDPIGEGERNINRKDGTRQHDRYVAPDENGRYMGGLMMMDLMQAVSYLLTRPDVDPRRIGATGYSMGSFVTAVACAVDTRIHACAPTAGGFLDGTGGYWDSSTKKMCQAIPYQSLAFLGDRGPVLYSLNALRGPMLIHNGTTDEVVAIPSHGPDFFAQMRADTVKAFGTGKGVFTYSFTPDGGHRPYFVTRPVATWFHEQLHFPNWKAISDGETKISDWAKANQVPMDKAYADDHREGGTIALGKNIPWPAHDQLNAIPETEWREHQKDYIQEGWYERIPRTVQ